MSSTLHTSAKLVMPTVTPLLDGSFDVNYIQHQGRMKKPLAKNFATKPEAELFAENQHVIYHYRKIESFLENIKYLQYSYKDTYTRMLPFIGNVRLALNLVTPETTRQDFAELLNDGLMANLMQLKGRRNSAIDGHCTRLLTLLDAFVKAYYVPKNDDLDFTKSHQFNTHLGIKNNLQVLK